MIFKKVRESLDFNQQAVLNGKIYKAVSDILFDEKFLDVTESDVRTAFNNFNRKFFNESLDESVNDSDTDFIIEALKNLIAVYVVDDAKASPVIYSEDFDDPEDTETNEDASVSIVMVQALLKALQNCSSIYVEPTRKNLTFMKENGLKPEQYVELFKQIKASEFKKAMKSTLPKYKDDLLFVFQCPDMKLSDRKEPLQVFVKLNVDRSDADSVLTISFHKLNDFSESIYISKFLPESLNEAKQKFGKRKQKEIFEFIDDLGGYGDYDDKVESVMDEFDLSREDAEDIVWEWSINQDDLDLDESLKESVNDVNDWISIYLEGHPFDSADEMIEYISDYEDIDALEDRFRTDIIGAIEDYFENNLNESLNEDIDDDSEDDEESSNWLKVISKPVPDSDGFLTDYTMYRDLDDPEHYVFVFGDNEIYSPDDENWDYEAFSNEEATEWYNNYEGFTEEDEDEE